MDSALKRVDATDGYSLQYRVWPCARPRATVILFNGIMSHSQWFEPLVPGLASFGLALVGADRRGSGSNTDGRGDAPGGGQLVEDALAVIDAEAGTGPLVLLGWCWGAGLAILTAHKLAGRVSGLVLVTPGLHPSAAVRAAADAQQHLMDAGPPDEARIVSPVAEEMFTLGPALDGFIRRDDARVRKMSPRLLDISVRLSMAAGARLPRLQVPVLLILGRDDEATDNDATLAAVERLPQPQRTIVTVGGGHGIQFDAADAVVRHIGAFAAKVVP